MRNDQVYVLEANPRASRTVPFVSKAVGLPLARLAARVMAGERLSRHRARACPPRPTFVSVEEARATLSPGFLGEDTVLLGPEMKSTGEVMGRDLDFGRALAKAHLGSGEPLPAEGTGFPEHPRRRQARDHVHGEETGRAGVWTGGDAGNQPIPAAGTASPAARCSRFMKAGRTSST